MSPRTGSLTTEKSSVGLPVEILETDANSSSTRLIRVRSLADAWQSTWLLSHAMLVCSAQAGCELRRTAMPIRAAPLPRDQSKLHNTEERSGGEECDDE